MTLVNHLEGITQDKFETLFACARGNASPAQGISAVEDIKEHIIGFSGAYRVLKVDPSMHRTYVSLTKNLTKTMSEIEQYMQDKQITDNPPAATPIESAITNLQLLISSLRQVASTIDKSSTEE